MLYFARRSIARRAARSLTLVGLVACGSLIALSAQPPVPEGPSLELTVAPPAQPDRIAVAIELNQPSAARVYADVIERAGNRDAATLAAAAAAGRTQLQFVQAEQAQVAAALQAFDPNELFRVGRAMNAITAMVRPADVAALAQVAGVKAIHRLEPEYPTNGTSVPFIGAPAVWDVAGLGITGTGIDIGIIDTGVDYQHATFGGTGALADYSANNRTVAPDAYFPTAKVVGGFDFAGDAYNGANAAQPDGDPMDCNGHGTHVAGTAAGFGVNADGTTFAGPFGTTVPFASLRIGPGSAPGARVYALRVFGCTGGTNLTLQAIDWAMDPNDDGDLSDHLDVINMSLGSSFGTLTSPSAIAADNAAAAGVIVVTSAGNAGDTYFVSGSPGVGQPRPSPSPLQSTRASPAWGSTSTRPPISPATSRPLERRSVRPRRQAASRATWSPRWMRRMPPDP